MPPAAACKAILKSVRGKINDGLVAEAWPGAEWTESNYAAVLVQIASSAYGAVPCLTLRNNPRSGGGSAITSMVKNKLLLYRSYDAVARDVPAEAFGDDEEAVYMLPSVAHLVIARRMLGAGQLL
jgi:hypothetical protein